MKSFLRTVLVSTALMTTVAVATAAETVVWWDFLGGGDGVRMKKLIEDFNAANAGSIEIQGTTLDWGVPFYTKVQTSAAVGEGPDVMTYHASRIPLAVSQSTLSEITPEDMAAIAALLGANSTLNVEVATTINSMAQTMPTRAQMFPNGPGGAPDKRYVKVITDSQVTETVVKGKTGGPIGPTTTTTGGSSSLDETLKKITDNVDRTVEQKQSNPTPTGI